MEIMGYIAAFFMGVTLGSIGGGGSILTVPILVYLMGVSPVIATGYSLLIVGSAASIGAFRYYRKGQINVRAAITFAVASIVSVYVTRLYIMPSIPDILIRSPITVTKDSFIMVLFAFLMVASSIMLFVNSRKLADANPQSPHYGLVAITALGVGLMTGILGAGGGFLIIPSLVLLMQIPMKKAVGTSLLIIAINSSVGFIGDMQRGETLEFPMLAYFFAATAIGMVLATMVSHRFDGKKLQQFFALFTVVVATIIFVKELF